jgi:ATP-dependent exoDNAse (exonuclease V) alpha subunit
MLKMMKTLTYQFLRKTDLILKIFDWSNKKRKLINIICLTKYLENYSGITFDVKKLTYDDNTQDFTLGVGMPIISRINYKSLDVVNNELFKVKAIKHDFIVVQNEMRTLEIPKNKFNMLFVIAFCMTIHRSQGATFDENYTIHEWKHLDKRLKYVALSRASDINLVKINE